MDIYYLPGACCPYGWLRMFTNEIDQDHARARRAELERLDGHCRSRLLLPELGDEARVELQAVRSLIASLG